jgi:hypothetical protein
VPNDLAATRASRASIIAETETSLRFQFPGKI